jgi:hypothetical protein
MNPIKKIGKLIKRYTNYKSESRFYWRYLEANTKNREYYKWRAL